MALTSSTMMQLGTRAPDFCLVDVISEEYLSLDRISSNQTTVIMFLCNHCPYVKHVLSGLVSLSQDYKEREISFVGINSNDVENYPADSPEKMQELASECGNPFPYLFDETQQVAKAYSAACTPDFFVFDRDLRCIYRGQLDDSRPGNGIPVTGADIRNALDAILEGKSINSNQKPSIGCNIKWK